MKDIKINQTLQGKKIIPKNIPLQCCVNNDDALKRANKKVSNAMKKNKKKVSEERPKSTVKMTLGDFMVDLN